MIIEMYSLISVVPNVRNNMSTGDLARYRFDSLEVTGFHTNLMYSLLMYPNGEQEFKEKFYEELEEFKEFVETRKQEEWNWQTTYGYKYAHSTW